MILAVDGVEFSYNSRPVLKNVEFEVNRGELFSILGNNGAGKTTLLKCLNKILRPQRGTILVEEKDLAALGPREVARRLGYVAQRHESTRFTVFDAVLLGRKPTLSGGPPQETSKSSGTFCRPLAWRSFLCATSTS